MSAPANSRGIRFACADFYNTGLCHAARSPAGLPMYMRSRGSDQGFRDENAIQVLRTLTLSYEFIVSVEGGKGPIGSGVNFQRVVGSLKCHERVKLIARTKLLV